MEKIQDLVSARVYNGRALKIIDPAGLHGRHRRPATLRRVALALVLLAGLSVPVSPVSAGQAGFDWPVVQQPQAKVVARQAIAWPVVYPDDSISILLAGDTGFGGHGQPVVAGYGVRHGRRTSFSEMSNGIRPLMTTDLAFANLETVVVDHNRLSSAGKRFVFRSHPSGVAHLLGLGFNLFSTSNNHVGDYHLAGMRETLQNLDSLGQLGHEFAAAGIGQSRQDAARPQHLKIKGADIYFSAMGIGAGNVNMRGAPDRIGHLHYNTRADFEDGVAGLKNSPDGYRILSVHYGEERSVYPLHGDIAKLRDTVVRDANVDLVIGHHAHVARGVARVDGKLIFYGLGNFMHPGMQDMGKFGTCQDFGLVARVHIGRVGADEYRAMAVEAVPIQGMHDRPAQMSAARARQRIAVLNGLASRLDHKETNSEGVRFRVRADGTGLACFAGAGQMSGRIGELCGSIARQTDDAARESQSETPEISCSGRSTAYAGAASRRSYAKRKDRRKKRQYDYFNPFGF